MRIAVRRMRERREPINQAKRRDYPRPGCTYSRDRPIAATEGFD